MDVDTNVAYEKPINFTNGTFISQHASEEERPCKQTQFPTRTTPMYYIYICTVICDRDENSHTVNSPQTYSFRARVAYKDDVNAGNKLPSSNDTWKV